MSLKRIFPVFAAALLFTPPILATTIVIQPTGIASDFPQFSGNIDFLIDRSGLKPDPGYVSGDPYQNIIGPPPVTHAGLGDTNSFRSTTLTGFFDLGLDKPYNLTNFALWNGVAGFGIDGFDLFVSMDNSFDASELVLKDNASKNNPPQAQSFNFAETQGMFVRLQVTSSFSANSIALGEFALGGEVISTPVPEPATAAPLGLALAGFAFRRRRPG